MKVGLKLRILEIICEYMHDAAIYITHFNCFKNEFYLHYYLLIYISWKKTKLNKTKTKTKQNKNKHYLAKSIVRIKFWSIEDWNPLTVVLCSSKLHLNWTSVQTTNGDRFLSLLDETLKVESVVDVNLKGPIFDLTCYFHEIIQ